MRHLKKKVAAVRRKLEEGEAGSQSGGESDLIKQEYIPVKQEEPSLTKEESMDSMESTDSPPEPTKKGKANKTAKKEEIQTNGRSSRSTTKKKKEKGFDSDEFKIPVDGKNSKGATSAKNIIKNYGRALQNFAISNMVMPYLAPLIQREQVLLKDFRKFFYSKKKQVRSIAGLRSLLLVSREDDNQTAAFKRIFKEISIIFIKFFSVNWIFSGKLLNKIAHLKCRFKMLRRIKNPENFTYLKGFL